MQQNVMATRAKVADQGNEARQMKAMQKEKMHQNKRIEEAKAQNMKQMIRQQQNEAMNKRQMDLIEKQNRARAQVEEKLQREAYE